MIPIIITYAFYLFPFVCKREKKKKFLPSAGVKAKESGALHRGGNVYFRRLGLVLLCVCVCVCGRTLEGLRVFFYCFCGMYDISFLFVSYTSFPTKNENGGAKETFL